MTTRLESDAPPPVVPDYTLLRALGRGSYGEVWLARGVTGLFRAVKIVRRSSFRDDGPYEREFNGVRRFAEVSLGEPSQLALLHVGRDDAAGFFYYVMELADDVARGREIDPKSYAPHTLKELRRGPPQSVAKVLELGAALARALASLHAHGLVHRDVKPSNVIFVGGVPKLADIGLVTDAAGDHSVVGTPGFIAPIGMNRPEGDVYALGKVLYELVTGLDRLQWPRLPGDLARREDRKALLELNEVLVRACESDPRKQFRDAAAMLTELRLVQAGSPMRPLKRQLRRALRASAVLAAVSAVALGGAWVQFKRAERAEAEREELSRRRTYSGNLASTQRALELSDLGRARRLLNELRPRDGQTELRGLEWYVLWREAQGDARVVLREGGPAITQLAVSPDGRWLAAHDGLKRVIVYDAAAGTEVWQIPKVAQLAGFSADLKWVVGVDDQSRLRRWATGSALPDEPGPRARWRFSFPRGNAEIIGVVDGPAARIVGWNFVSRKEFANVDCSGDPEDPWAPFRGEADQAGENVVLAAVRESGSKAEFRILRVSLGESTRVLDFPLGRRRPGVVGIDSFGPWVGLDVSGALLRPDRLEWLDTGERIPSGARCLVRVSASGPSVRVVAHDRTLTWLGTTSPSHLPRADRGHGGMITSVAAAPTDGQVFSAAADGSLYAWERFGPVVPPRTYQGWDFNAGTAGIVFLPDGESLWIPGDESGCVRLSVGALAPLARAEGMRYPVAVTPEGMLGVAIDGSLLWTDPLQGTERKRVRISNAPARLAVSTPDGRCLAVVDHAGELRVATGTGVRLVPGDWRRHFCMALSRTGDRLLITDTQKRLRCLSLPDCAMAWEATLPALAPHFLLLSGEREIAVALENGTIEIRDANSGSVHRQFDAGSAAPQALSLSGDGRRLFVGGGAGDVNCFDSQVWEPVHILNFESGPRLHVLASAPGGGCLAALSKTGALHVLRAR